MPSIDVESLRDKVKTMYQAVADAPHGTFHFEMGYDLAARLGYPTSQLDQVPTEARILEPGGRLAISDIVTERPLTEAIICDVNLWASCIGGAMQEDDYRAAIEAAGLSIDTVQENPQYRFISDSAQGATDTFGVKSISILATKR